MVGSEAWMRVSSVTLPPFSGTLKSTRQRTCLPFRSMSLMLFLAMPASAAQTSFCARSTTRLE